MSLSEFRPVRLLRRLLRRMGLDVQRYHPLSFPNLRRQRLLAHHRVDLVLDVGANVGQYARKLREHGYAGAIVSFEPASAAFAQLQLHAARDPHWTCRREALSCRTGTAELNLAGDSVSSSLLTPTPTLLACVRGAEPIGHETVRCVRLDDLARELDLGKRKTLLKLDVQGSELDALRGAEGALAVLELVEAEQSLVPLYERAPEYWELLGFLERHGFELVSIEPNTLDPRTGHVIEINALFARGPAQAMAE
jgi:FkbM family methyltransferase